MRICIDIQAAIGQQAGVGRYTRCLVEQLARSHGDHELRLFYFDFRRQGSPFAAGEFYERAVRCCPGRIVQKAWKTIGLPPFELFAGAADLYHFPNFVRPPLRRGKSVVTIHDVSFLRHPETTEEKNLRYLRAQIHKTVARADAIITDSRFSKAEIEALLDVDRARVFAVHLGLEQKHRTVAPEDLDALRARYRLERPYLLSVGTLEPRKNYSFLIDMFERMEDFDGDLVIAGMPGWKYEPVIERARSSRLGERIRILEYVDERHLAALYAAAELFVITSLYEGFGFTPLEAMLAGTPVLSSRGGSLPEVLGDAAVLLAGFDAEEWAETAGGLLADSERRARLSAAGREHVGRYSWEKCAAETLAVYESVAGDQS
jgi:glycosyltransferase involved in cell wall biosynthesis